MVRSRISVTISLLVALAVATAALAADWPQGAGPAGDYAVADSAPTQWNATTGAGIKWSLTLPETGQSTPVIVGNKVLFTTLKPVSEDSPLATDVVAWCCDADTGEVLWQRPLPGRYESRCSGNFGDASSPAAVSDGKLVVFITSSGLVACFDLDGSEIWRRDFLTVNRTQAFLHNDHVVLTRQVYEPEQGNFSHEHKNAPLPEWTQLHCLNLATGKDGWTSSCGVNMGNHVIKQQLTDGRSVAVVGRGGGHGPPEKPEGISLVDLADGSTVWTLELPGFMATQSYPIRNDLVSIFHKGEHLLIDALTGTIKRRDAIAGTVAVRKRQGEGWADGVVDLAGKKPRMITQGSDVMAGDYHYFRNYLRPWLGRVHLRTGKVEYLELPLQLVRAPGAADRLHWHHPPKGKQDKLEFQSLVPNEMRNSRGFLVMGDKRSVGNGWGHTASPPPTVAGDHLYLPVQNGTVYVVQWGNPTLNETAIVAINDLGPAGKSFTRASLAVAKGHLFAHTIQGLLCIGK